jgi:hypothetical protein
MGPHASEVFFDNVAFTSTGDTVSNTIQGDADGAEVEIWVHTPFTTSASGTLQFTLKECATVGGSYTDVLKTKAYAVSELAKSQKEPLIRFSVPRGRLAFLELVATVATGAMTAGSVDAHLINRQL